MSQHILIVDDDSLMRRGLVFHLEQAGFRTSSASSAETALEVSRRDPPALVLLDISLPGMDGLEALRHFQQQFSVPIIFVTARRRHLDEVLGLELGADDYVTKPFQMDVLMARIRAALRVRREVRLDTSPNILDYGDLLVNRGTREVTVAGEVLDLAPREYDLLYTLALAAGDVVRREELLQQVWGAEFAGEPQVLYVHISWLREKIEENPKQPRRIITVHGVGYKLERVEVDATNTS